MFVLLFFFVTEAVVVFVKFTVITKLIITKLKMVYFSANTVDGLKPFKKGKTFQNPMP